MADPSFQEKLKALTESFGQPNFIIFGWQDAEGKVSLTYALHKMKLKAALSGMLEVVKTIINKSLK